MLELVRPCTPLSLSDSLTLLKPDLLQHLTECHDPLAALHRERGDKIVSIPVSLSSLLALPH